MTMSNEEKDIFIKETLKKDQYVLSSNENLKTEIEKDINVSKIKLKKYTYRQRRFTKFLAILLCISLAFNAYLANNNIAAQKLANNFNEILENVKNQEVETLNLDDTNDDVAEDINTQLNEIEDNNITDIPTITPIKPQSNIEDVIIEDKITEKTNYSLEIDDEILKEEIANYAISIGRFEGQIDTLEENTILLLMASNSFSGKKGPTGLDTASSPYALTAENVHLFIAELTGTKVDGFLNSYANYIGYSDFSKGYVFGKDSNVLKNEKYEVLTIKLNNKNNDGYKVTGTIQKTVGNAECIYDFTAVIGIHTEYTYNPYKIKSFTAELQKGHTDNVIRLVDYVEEEPKDKR